MIAVKFIEGTNDTIEGPGMPWGGPFNGQDLEGEHFSANTDFAFDLFPPDSRPLMYHHGLDKDAGVSAVGRVKSYEVKADLGVWTRAQLDRSSEYFDAIAELVSAGKLFFSSGAMAHLVKVNRKSGEILRWPWTELSLTPTPANLYATVSMLDATKHFEMAGLKAIWDEKESGLKAAISKERMQGLCAEMEVEMTPEEMQQMLSEMPDADEEAMRACLSKRKGAKSAATKAVSWQEVGDQVRKVLDKRLMQPVPYDVPGCVCIEETYSDHVIACVWDAQGEEHYFSVPFTLAEDGNVASVGEPIEVEETYVPKKPEQPLALMAWTASKYVASLADAVEAVRERRIKEGRQFSSRNDGTLRKEAESQIQHGQAVIDSANKVITLLDSTAPAPKGTEDPTKMANVRRQMDLLKLYMATLATSD